MNTGNLTGKKEGLLDGVTTVLFDLDGTLLPMNQDEFTRGYFKLLAAKLAPYGYEPKALIDAVWTGTLTMVKNDGTCTNEEAFWKKFSSIYGEKKLEDYPLFVDFYENDFAGARVYCDRNPKAAEVVQKMKAAGLRVALATNPLFPMTAIEQRIRWAGLEPSDFELITAYENIGFCKPNPDYYREILRRLDVVPEECLMVGNDVGEDMVASKLGMPVYLLTDCLLNRANEDIQAYPQGGFDGLLQLL